MTKQDRINKAKELFNKYPLRCEIKAPFDSGKNLLIIAGLSKKNDIVPFQVNDNKLILFYKPKTNKQMTQNNANFGIATQGAAAKQTKKDSKVVTRLQPEQITKTVEPAKVTGEAHEVRIINYSDFAIQLTGTVKEDAAKIKSLDFAAGKYSWNKYLKCWFVSKKHLEALECMFNVKMEG